MKYLKDHPEIEHGKIRIGFTPDEEIGEGANHFAIRGVTSFPDISGLVSRWAIKPIAGIFLSVFAGSVAIR
mgnify:CR=1 FL=1